MANNPPNSPPVNKFVRVLTMFGFICAVAFFTSLANNENNPLSNALDNTEGKPKKNPTKNAGLRKPTPASASIPITGECLLSTPEGQTSNAPVTESAFFAGQEDPIDGASVQAGASFKKTWSITNDGAAAWENGTILYFVDGYQMGAPKAVEVPAALPGQVIVITLTLKAPLRNGRYRADWRLCNTRSRPFGPPLWVDINVTSSK